MKEAAVKLCNHTHNTYLLSLSTSLASCNLKMDSGVLFHTLYATITNSQCHKNQENAYRHSLQSFLLILLWRSYVSGIVKKRALKQNKNKYNCLQKCWKLSLTPKFWGPTKSAALGLTLFSVMVNPNLHLPKRHLCWRYKQFLPKSTPMLEVQTDAL